MGYNYPMGRVRVPTPKTAWTKLLVYYRTHDVNIVLEKMRATCGEAYFGENLIKLDPRRDILNTLVHELLHLTYPELEESSIVILEGKICAKLTTRQYRFLIRTLYEHTNTIKNKLDYT